MYGTGTYHQNHSHVVVITTVGYWGCTKQHQLVLISSTSSKSAFLQPRNVFFCFNFVSRQASAPTGKKSGGYILPNL